MNLYSVSDGLFVVIRPATAFSPFHQPVHKSVAIRFEIEQEIDFAKLFLKSLCDLELPGRAIDQILLNNKKNCWEITCWFVDLRVLISTLTVSSGGTMSPLSTYSFRI